MTEGTKRIPATLIKGDGIGPEITGATLAVLDALGSPFVWDEQTGGETAIALGLDPLPDATLESIRRTKLALKGPLGTPSGGSYRSVNVRLREAFNLFANVRPARTIVPGRYDGIDIIVVRENLEGAYTGDEHWEEVEGDPKGAGVAIVRNTRKGAERIVRYAFDMAVRLGRRKVTVVHKSNIIKIASGLFLSVAMEIAKEYEGRLEVDSMIVDATAERLVTKPEIFDVIVTTNLFGDILSDQVAGLVGGLGLIPGGNIGTEAAIFEAVHGTAPDIAGQNKANPTALMLSAATMLDHVGEHEKATRLRNAIEKTLQSGQRTGDLARLPGTVTVLSTSDYAKAVIANLG